MDIYYMLDKSGDELYPEDLDFFETELATGEYSEDYILECTQKIAQLRKWMDSESDQPASQPKQDKPKKSGGVYVSLADLAPGINNPSAVAMKPEDMIFRDINNIREQNDYKSEFKKYVAGKEEIDADFIEKYYSFFKPWEMGAIVSVKQLGEDFLEKYFGALDHDKIARYQLFSESFFMKHFSQLDAEFVLKRGKNDWRDKSKRSKQLDVFLRLKGISF